MASSTSVPVAGPSSSSSSSGSKSSAWAKGWEIEKPPKTITTIGVDLGTWRSVGGYYRGDLPILITFDGQPYLPSVVAFPPGREPLIGKAAEEYGLTHPTLTVSQSKRLMGRLYGDIADDLRKKVAYKIEPTSDGYCMIVLTDPATKKEYRHRPETIASIILTKIKMEAECQSKNGVQNAVITVPAYFDDSQRQATARAAEYSGLNIIRLINEPSSASLVIGRTLPYSSEAYVLVFDIGGGTYDTSIVHIKRDEDGKTDLRVKAVAGINFIGGVEFDQSIIDIVFTNLSIQLDYPNEETMLQMIPPEQMQEITQRVRDIAETTKVDICRYNQATVDLQGLLPGVDFFQVIGISEFDSINEAKYDEIMKQVPKVIGEAKMTKDQITHVMLVGGSSHIPKLRQLIKDYFGGMELYEFKPEQDVFAGAAMIASKFDGNPAFRWINLQDAMSFDIGVKDHYNKMSVIVPKYTKLPYKKTIPFETTHKNQTSAKIMVFEGNNDDVYLNRKLGEFTFKDMVTQVGKCTPFNIKVEVSEETGIIKLCVEEIWGGKSEIAYFDKETSPQLSEEVKKQIAKDTAALTSQVKGVYRMVDYRNQLHAICHEMPAKLKKIFDERQKAAEEMHSNKTNPTPMIFSIRRDLIAKFEYHSRETIKWIRGPLSQRISLEELTKKRYLLVDHFNATLRNEEWTDPNDPELLEKALKAKGEASLKVEPGPSKRPRPVIMNEPYTIPIPQKKIKQEKMSDDEDEGEENKDEDLEDEDSADDSEQEAASQDDDGAQSDTAQTEILGGDGDESEPDDDRNDDGGDETN